MPTHKKGHDKDKYYHLAKDQGYRSRAAFKLIQINKRFDFLSKAHVLIDLCAAPGGWCQVAAKYMPVGSIILGIDLLPIRPIRNVKTIVSDITTSECRKIVTSELQGYSADVVLCDGAPNIGSSYSKDAYVQNELVLAALKTATDHLVAGGTFCTKVYRSVDYNALMWVFQQLFEDVQAIKPSSSRSQSSEIFIVCLKYSKPKYIDPKLLDPNHVFKEVTDPGLKKIDVMHKKFDKHNQRHRTGYDESKGMLLKSSVTLSTFMSDTDPVRLLTDTDEIVFSPACEKYKSSLTDELRECFKDLRVLGKLDFKKILKWRQKMRKEYAMEKSAMNEPVELSAKTAGDRSKADGAEDEQLSFEDELSNIHIQLMERDRKEKKKDRKKLQKEAERSKLGMRNCAFEVTGDDELFSISTSNSLKKLANEDFADMETTIYELDDDDDDDVAPTGRTNEDDLDDELEAEELEADYDRYRHGIRKKFMASNNDVLDSDEERATVSGKKAKLSRRPSAILSKHGADDVQIDGATSFADASSIRGDIESYVKLLTSGNEKKVRENKRAKYGNDEETGSSGDRFGGFGGLAKAVVSDDDSSDDDNADGFDDENYQGGVPGKRSGAVDMDDSMTWFSHPIFKESVCTVKGGGEKASAKTGERLSKAATEMLQLMPKTDKEIRSAKRKRVNERKERRDAKKSGKLEDESMTSFEIVHHKPEGKTGNNEDEDGNALDAETRAFRDLIKKGMGKLGGSIDYSQEEKSLSSKVKGGKAASSFEVVKSGSEGHVHQPNDPRNPSHPQYGSMPAVHDTRDYDSENEDYDAHDHTMTLALGTLMLRKTRQKALVDASYNRFSWNDPKSLPSWFMDDELRHNKPQLPIPAALVEQIKARFQSTGTKEIKKVAEARMRKRKRAMTKLKNAKRTATAAAENSEMSEREKVKAVSKAMKAAKVDKPGKVYVVTHKSKAGSMGTSKGGKGQLKFVDKRMKKEQRAARAAKKKGKR